MKRPRRGRPPGSDGAATTQRLLDAATVVCAERGFDGSTLAAIARRAGISSAAVYNHFASREDLLYAAAVRAIGRMTDLAQQAGADGIAAAYLRPEMRESRRLIAELHSASGRDPRLAQLLAAWHKDAAADLLARLRPDHPWPDTAIKATYLILLGLCHLDDVSAVEASTDDVARTVQNAIRRILAPNDQH